MKITLIRHGESVANVGNFISDDPRKPVGLTDKGRAQAESLAQRLREEVFSHAYTSQFPRARETASILLRHHDCRPMVDARLNERKSGMDGLPVHLFNDQVKCDPLHFTTRDGESFVQQMERLRGFLDELASRHPEGNILAVSHENPIIAALALTVEDASTVVLSGLENCGRLDLNWPRDAFHKY
ncbi:MAG TPA: histidine phosphatase family protein [Gallionellaceae bacterium]|nr:histidine phosphatase family protein [Gallionellaceae bacterium]